MQKYDGMADTQQSGAGIFLQNMHAGTLPREPKKLNDGSIFVLMMVYAQLQLATYSHHFLKRRSSPMSKGEEKLIR